MHFIKRNTFKRLWFPRTENKALNSCHANPGWLQWMHRDIKNNSSRSRCKNKMFLDHRERFTGLCHVLAGSSQQMKYWSGSYLELKILHTIFSPSPTHCCTTFTLEKMQSWNWNLTKEISVPFVSLWMLWFTVGTAAELCLPSCSWMATHTAGKALQIALQAVSPDSSKTPMNDSELSLTVCLSPAVSE